MTEFDYIAFALIFLFVSISIKWARDLDVIREKDKTNFLIIESIFVALALLAVILGALRWVMTVI